MDSESDTINFLWEYDPYGEFANFYITPITVDGIEYATPEHYYQAMKFYPNQAEMDEVRNAPTPRDCKKIARGEDDKRQPREGWDDIKNDVMYKALQVKFNTHEHCKKVLLDTGDKYQNGLK